MTAEEAKTAPSAPREVKLDGRGEGKGGFFNLCGKGGDGRRQGPGVWMGGEVSGGVSTLGHI